MANRPMNPELERELDEIPTDSLHKMIDVLNKEATERGATAVMAGGGTKGAYLLVGGNKANAMIKHMVAILAAQAEEEERQTEAEAEAEAVH